MRQAWRFRTGDGIMMRGVKRLQGFLAAVIVLAVTFFASGSVLVSAATTEAGSSVTVATDAGTSDTVTYTSVHDPGVVVGYVESSVTSISSDTVVVGEADETYNKEVYFVFGSHCAWSYSWDLMNWTSFRNNINSNYETLFAAEFAWAAMGDSAYDASGNMWAPDVTWNPDYVNEDGSTGAWCMYMSINGCSWNSSICLLTADSLSGDWTYVGTVLYSGFTEEETHDYTRTDYVDVTGDEELAERYQTTAYTCYDDETACTDTTWNSDYGAHAIDPCVVFDEDGNLYMTYGSWSGGIYMIELAESTGLRDNSVEYENTDTQDPYMGYKLAGGNSVSGEGSYICKIGDYYYLFITYGGLESDGGYNMRYYRSESIIGDYVDINGTSALEAGSDYYSQAGVRTMSYYSWDYMTYGYAAEGHNSVLVDDDGGIYLVYHARSTDGTEGHSVRVHQMFVTEDGWLTVAPFEYSGESLSSVSTSDVAGMYEVIFQDETSYGGLGCNTGVAMYFASNGTVSGSGYSGTWSWSSSKGAPYVDVTINGATYEGVFVEQRMENEAAAGASAATAYSLGDSVMTFSILQMTDTNGTSASNYQLSVWGFQYTETPTISSVSGTSTGVKISWASQTYAEKYIVYRKTASGSWTKLTTTTSRTYTDTTASSGTLYYYTVGYISCGGTYTSSYGTHTKSIRWLAQPEKPTLSATSSGLKVSWSAVSGAQKYIIYRRVGSNPWSEYATTTSASYTDTSVSNNKTYSYSIRAYYSSSVQSTYNSTGSSFTYHKATSISSVTNTSSGVKVVWSKVSGASTYQVWRKTSSGSWTRLTTTSSTSYTDTSAKSGTKYYYRVRVYQSSVSYSAYSSSKARTFVKRPTLSSVKNASSGVTVSWGKVSGATKYYVYRKTSSGSWSKIASTTSTSYTDKKATNGTLYYYSVTAVCNSTQSVKAASKKTVRLTVPTISSMKTVTSKSLTVTYKKNSKATGYQIQYSTSSSFSSTKTVWVKSSSTLSKKLTGLTKGKKYYVRIRAYKTVSGTKYYSAWSAKSKTVTK